MRCSEIGGTVPQRGASDYVETDSGQGEVAQVRVGPGGGDGGYPAMQIEVPREALLETAKGLEAAANKLQTWLAHNYHRLAVVPPGNDQVSIDMAKWFNESAFGEMGAIPAAQQAVTNLLAAAQQMRDSAAQYTGADDKNAAALRSSGA